MCSPYFESIKNIQKVHYKRSFAPSSSSPPPPFLFSLLSNFLTSHIYYYSNTQDRTNQWQCIYNEYFAVFGFLCIIISNPLHLFVCLLTWSLLSLLFLLTYARLIFLCIVLYLYLAQRGVWAKCKRTNKRTNDIAK